ncbi:related to nonribosomal peptide synthetase [Fusarium fujikuroi]|nr:related to nonribosomal peptide synthetase [Fusarium fujikuroi]
MRHLSEVVEALAHQAADKCWVRIMQTSEERQAFCDITWSGLQSAVINFSSFMKNETADVNGRSTLAYLATSDVRCAAAIIAAIRTGTRLLILSSRNSVDVNQGLLDTTTCSHLLYGSGYEQQASKLSGLLPGLQCHKLKAYQDYFETVDCGEQDNSSHEFRSGETALILHSSGTTGRPKPIEITYGALAQMDETEEMPSPDGRKNKYSDMFSNDTLVTTLPFSHVMGLTTLARSIYSQGPLVLLPQGKPPTAHDMITAIRQSGALLAIFVPSMLQEVCDMSGGLDTLSSLKGVWYGGGPLNHACGDKISQVTKLLCGYGSTEMMTVFTLTPLHDEDWEYLEWHPEAGVVMEEVTETVFEMVIERKSDWRWQPVFYNYPNLSNWRSKDLFERHPSNGELWRYVGRIDDLIVLSNGEKINPASIEAGIKQHPLVTDAFVFGSGRFNLGILLELSESQTKPESIQERIDEVWPTLSEVNDDMPGHAKVLRSMILLSLPEKPFARSPKGSVNRQATLELYKSEIEDLYEGKEKFPDRKASLPDTEDSSRRLTNEIVESVRTVLGHLEDPPIDQDLFELGLDSLTALELADKIQESFAKIGSTSHECTAESLYKFPTIRKLVDNLSQPAPSDDTSSDQESGVKPSREENMSRLIHKYTAVLGISRATPSESKLTVVLTGSTGHLGSYILSSLLDRKDIGTIYCLNRSADAETKQKKRFQSMGLGFHDSFSDTIEFIHCDFNHNMLGISADKFDEIRTSMTQFIHCAWPVDFNKSLETFEKTAITGMVNCISFASEAEKKPVFIFISSIASVGNWSVIHAGQNQDPCIVPELCISDNSAPLHQGYGESKHVASCILANAVEKLGIRAAIIRVGQLCGPRSVEGRWNDSEWVPALIKSSITLGKLPRSLGNHSVDWVPIDTAASTIVDISMSSECSRALNANGREGVSLSCYNLVNPHIADWGDLIPAIQEYYKSFGNTDTNLEIVDLGDWIQDVENKGGASDQVHSLPAIKLLRLFKDLDKHTDAALRFSLENTSRSSAVFEKLGPITKQDMAKWLAAWNFMD